MCVCIRVFFCLVGPVLEKKHETHGRGGRGEGETILCQWRNVAPVNFLKGKRQCALVQNLLLLTQTEFFHPNCIIIKYTHTHTHSHTLKYLKLGRIPWVIHGHDLSLGAMSYSWNWTSIDFNCWCIVQKLTIIWEGFKGRYGGLKRAVIYYGWV